MARRIFEFVCGEGHLSDKLVDSECRVTHCPICDQPAERIISTPMVKLEGPEQQCNGNENVQRNLKQSKKVPLNA